MGVFRQGMNREPKQKEDRFMKTKRRKEKSQDIEELLEQIEEWRRTREKRTGMPEKLWVAAVSLLDKHTSSQVSS